MTETRLINRFSEKILIRKNEPFWVQKLHILITLDRLEEFFEILHNERGFDENNINKGFDENNINNFLKKIFFVGGERGGGTNGPFWAQK